MRIILDTDRDVIICPKSFFAEVAKKNEILKEAGAEPVKHLDEILKHWNVAIEKDLVRQQDLK